VLLELLDLVLLVVLALLVLLVVPMRLVYRFSVQSHSNTCNTRIFAEYCPSPRRRLYL
jgi:hypothetical protein